MTMSTWSAFTAEHLSRLAEQPLFVGDPGERCCPNCGGSVRQYLYESHRPTGPTIVSYVWCSACRHYHGSTGPRPANLRLEDPLRAPDAERMKIEENLAEFFCRLDALWDAGDLPQEVTF